MSKPNIDEHAVREVMDAIKSFGDFVRTARLARNLTQNQLAERMMVSRDTVRRLEAGDSGVSTGSFATALWCMGLDHVLTETLTPEADKVGQDSRMKSARERARSESPTDHAARMDF